MANLGYTSLKDVIQEEVWTDATRSGHASLAEFSQMHEAGVLPADTFSLCPVKQWSCPVRLYLAHISPTAYLRLYDCGLECRTSEVDNH